MFLEESIIIKKKVLFSLKESIIIKQKVLFSFKGSLISLQESIMIKNESIIYDVKQVSLIFGKQSNNPNGVP